MSQLIAIRAEDVGWSQAYREAYGEPEDITAREFALQLHARGLPIRDISAFVRLKYGIGCKSVIQRWVNPKSMALHLKNKRKLA